MIFFFIRFWSNLTKKNSIESAKYGKQIISTCTYSFRTFVFHGPVYFRLGSGFSANPDSGKSSIRIRKKPKSETLIIWPDIRYFWVAVCHRVMKSKRKRQISSELFSLFIKNCYSLLDIIITLCCTHVYQFPVHGSIEA